jgi:hypothetical protein
MIQRSTEPRADGHVAPPTLHGALEALSVTLVDGSQHVVRLSAGKNPHEALHELVFNECVSEVNRAWLACESGTWVRRDGIISVRIEPSDCVL